MGVSVQFHDPAALLPQKKDPVPIGHELSGPHSWSGHGGGKKILSLSEMDPPTLNQLLY